MPDVDLKEDKHQYGPEFPDVVWFSICRYLTVKDLLGGIGAIPTLCSYVVLERPSFCSLFGMMQLRSTTLRFHFTDKRAFIMEKDGEDWATVLESEKTAFDISMSFLEDEPLVGLLITGQPDEGDFSAITAFVKRHNLRDLRIQCQTLEGSGDGVEKILMTAAPQSLSLTVDWLPKNITDEVLLACPARSITIIISDKHQLTGRCISNKLLSWRDQFEREERREQCAFITNMSGIDFLFLRKTILTILDTQSNGHPGLRINIVIKSGLSQCAVLAQLRMLIGSRPPIHTVNVGDTAVHTVQLEKRWNKIVIQIKSAKGG